MIDDANPIETKTWWGGAIRGLVHFGSLAAAIIPAAKVAGVTAATTVMGSLARGAAVGATSDVISKYSQEDNGLAILRDRFNFIDTPLSTKDTDHPAMKTLKNVVEGMGIGAVFDGASIVIGKGIKKIRPAKVDPKVQKAARNKSIKRIRAIENELKTLEEQNPFTEDIAGVSNQLDYLETNLNKAKFKGKQMLSKDFKKK